MARELPGLTVVRSRKWKVSAFSFTRWAGASATILREGRRTLGDREPVLFLPAVKGRVETRLGMDKIGDMGHFRGVMAIERLRDPRGGHRLSDKKRQTEVPGPLPLKAFPRHQSAEALRTRQDHRASARHGLERRAPDREDHVKGGKQLVRPVRRPAESVSDSFDFDAALKASLADGEKPGVSLRQALP